MNYDCTNPEHQMIIAHIHEISEERFNELKTNYAAGNHGYEVSRTIVFETVFQQNKLCSQYKVKIEVEGGGDGLLTLEPGNAGGLKLFDNPNFFSIALFKGIFQKEQDLGKVINRFTFFNGKRHEDDETVIKVFMITFANTTFSAYFNFSDQE